MKTLTIILLITYVIPTIFNNIALFLYTYRNNKAIRKANINRKSWLQLDTEYYWDSINTMSCIPLINWLITIIIFYDDIIIPIWKWISCKKLKPIA